MLQFVQKLFT